MRIEDGHSPKKMEINALLKRRRASRNRAKMKKEQ